jgi:hypothetical protein
LIAILLTGGEARDCPVADRLIRRAELRCKLRERGIRPVIPNKSSGKQPFSFNNLKDFRCIATRYDKLALLDSPMLPQPR